MAAQRVAAPLFAMQRLLNATNNRIVAPRTATLRLTALLTTTQRNNHLGE
jgi:hypothetical protein